MHWNPDEDVARSRELRPAQSWPEGATAGLIMLAAGCIAFMALLYRLAAPADVFTP